MTRFADSNPAAAIGGPTEEIAMPLFDFLCLDCGALFEVLVNRSDDAPACTHCGSPNLKKMLSAHSSLSGAATGGLPGPGDTACCGSVPGQAAGCAGPGSCCGRH
jgi:putative FmdB family regulatory protein